MSTEPFLGTWRVTEVVPFSSHPEILHLEGDNKNKLDLVFNNVKPMDWYFVLD